MPCADGAENNEATDESLHGLPFVKVGIVSIDTIVYRLAQTACLSGPRMRQEGLLLPLVPDGTSGSKLSRSHVLPEGLTRDQPWGSLFVSHSFRFSAAGLCKTVELDDS